MVCSVLLPSDDDGDILSVGGVPLQGGFQLLTFLKFSKYFKGFTFSELGKSALLSEVVVAQLAERSLTIPEDPGSNPVIGNFY